MKIKELLDSPKVTISCELFPPKKGTELQNAMDIVHAIAIDGVDYMSVTYGAGGIDNVLALRGDRPQGWTSCRNRTSPMLATSSASSRKRGISAWAALPILRDILNRGPLMRIWRT